MAEQDSFPENSPNARFQRYSSPIAPPGKCAVCGAATRPVVDFGMTIEFYGAVLLCDLCLTEAARVIGMVPNAELIAAEKNSAQSFETQLRTRDMVAIPNEQLELISVAVGKLSNDFLDIAGIDAFTMAAQTEPTDTKLLENNAGPDTSKPKNNGLLGKPVGEEHGLTINEGPFSLSTNTGDGKSSKRSR